MRGRALPADSPGFRGLDLTYDRYTMGYPLESFAEGGRAAARGARAPGAGRSDDDGFSGFIAVFPRKRRFDRAAAQAVWKASKGRCHLCGKRWGANKRGGDGWMIDHVIPLATGGSAAGPVNFRLACSNCTIAKGRRGRQANLLRSIRDLAMRLTPST